MIYQKSLFDNIYQLTATMVGQLSSIVLTTYSTLSLSQAQTLP